MVSFARSPSAQAYADVCERYGLDPGAPFADDDYLAFQMRAAMAWVNRRRVPEEEPTAPFERTRQVGAALRKRLGL